MILLTAFDTFLSLIRTTWWLLSGLKIGLEMPVIPLWQNAGSILFLLLSPILGLDSLLIMSSKRPAFISIQLQLRYNNVVINILSILIFSWLSGFVIFEIIFHFSNILAVEFTINSSEALCILLLIVNLLLTVLKTSLITILNRRY